MLRATFTLLAFATFSLGANAAPPAFTAQDRSVEASSETIGHLWDENANPVFPDFDPPTLVQSGGIAADSASAAAFDPFSATVSTADPFVVILPMGTASASQTSSVSATSMSASGDYSAVSDAYFMSQAELDQVNFLLNPPVLFNFGIAGDEETGLSGFSVEFDVSKPTPYHLTASVALSEPQFFIFSPATTGNAALSLHQAGIGVLQTILVDHTSCPFEPCGPLSDSLDVEGVLAPGSYSLSAQATGTARSYCADLNEFICSEPTSDGSFDLLLELDIAASVPTLGAQGLALLSALFCLSGWRAARLA